MADYTLSKNMTYEETRIVHQYVQEAWAPDDTVIFGSDDLTSYQSTGMIFSWSGSVPIGFDTDLTDLVNNLDSLTHTVDDESPLTITFAGFNALAAVSCHVLLHHPDYNGFGVYNPPDTSDSSGEVVFYLPVLLDGSWVEIVTWQDDNPANNGYFSSSEL
jgi:hypothetical protein